MSLDINLVVERQVYQDVRVFETNITHNLTDMADLAGLYKPLWHPWEAGIRKASDLVPVLTQGIAAMEADPEKFKALNPANGWGSYEWFVPWLVELLDRCMEFPDARIEANG